MGPQEYTRSSFPQGTRKASCIRWQASLHSLMKRDDSLQLLTLPHVAAVVNTVCAAELAAGSLASTALSSTI